MSPDAIPPRPAARPLPLDLILWGAIGIALNVGLARFTYGVMLPSIRRDLSLEYLGSGNLNAVHLAGYLVGTLVAPRINAGTGPATLAKWAHFLVAAAALVCAVAPASPVAGPLVLGVGRFATGLGAGAGIVAILVIVFGAVAPERRPQASAAVWAGMGVAIVASGLLVPFLLGPAIGWRCAFVFSALLALAVAIGFPPRQAPVPAALPEADDASEFAARRVWTAEWICLLGAYLLFGVAYVAYATFAGARLAAMNAGHAVVAVTWIGFGVASVFGAGLAAMVIGSPRLKQHALFVALATAAAGALVAAADSAGAAIAGALLVGLGLAATPSIITANARDRCTAGQYPRAFSYATAALGIGQLVGPVAGGALADRFGTIAIPLLAAGAYAVAALLATADARVARRVKLAAAARSPAG
ncbi:YbfB/YjiJ family MFS transporter [Ramlibacter sp. PS4R-6]|uniref:YbfB/YjiJ family MFS transporter n=1 Tax=Ramlibacter sp. PS4R-6 TaxID=3133438 RepID=UPI00309C7C2B